MLVPILVAELNLHTAFEKSRWHSGHRHWWSTGADNGCLSVVNPVSTVCFMFLILCVGLGLTGEH